MNDDDLVKLEQNAFRDSMKDGVTELFGSFIFVVLAIIYVQPSFVGILVVFYLILAPQLIERFRQKHTYPRIGYVKLKTDVSEFKALPLLLLALAIILGTGVATQVFTGDILDPYNWLMAIPVTLGLIMLGPSFYLVEKSGSKLYYAFGVFASILGLTVSFLTTIYPPTLIPPYLDGAVAFCMIFGVTLAIVGLFKLAYFLRTNPVLDSQEDALSE